MKCKKCGHEIEEGHDICLNCGSAVNFEEPTDEETQEEKIESIIKQKPVKRISRQMMGGVLTFIIACLFVGICMSYAGKTINMYSDGPTPAKGNKSTQAESTSYSPAEPETYGVNIITNNEYRKLPLRITAFSAETANGSMPKIYITVENTSDTYVINNVTVRIVAFDKDGKRLSKSNSENGKYIDAVYRKVIAPGEKSDKIEVTMSGFQKGVKFTAAVISARSDDGFIYEPSESALNWKSATIQKES